MILMTDWKNWILLSTLCLSRVSRELAISSNVFGSERTADYFLTFFVRDHLARVKFERSSLLKSTLRHLSLYHYSVSNSHEFWSHCNRPNFAISSGDTPRFCRHLAFEMNANQTCHAQSLHIFSHELSLPCGWGQFSNPDGVLLLEHSTRRVRSFSGGAAKLSGRFW